MKRTDLTVGGDYAYATARPFGGYSISPEGHRVTIVDAGRWDSRTHWEALRIREARDQRGEPVPTFVAADGSTVDLVTFRPATAAGTAEGVLVRGTDGRVKIARTQHLVLPWDEYDEIIQRERRERRDAERRNAERKAVTEERATTLRARYGALVGREISPYALGAHSDGRVTLDADQFEALLNLAQTGKDYLDDLARDAAVEAP